jgi:NAD(P)-dependent dehydrogenase (short-subunit alcohol dehydrogenase family)
MGDFDGRGVLVTGASRGIGRVIAARFAAEGARVGVHYGQNESAAGETLGRLAGDGHVLVGADLSDPDAVARMIDEAVGGLGGLDVLVNNAGVYEMHHPAEVTYEQWQEAWRQTIEINLTGAANASFLAARHMREHGGGRIVNVSSRGAFRGEAKAPAYGASKAGMNAMGQSLAVALAPFGVTVATVAPGWVDTDMSHEHLDGPRGQEILSGLPMGRVAAADEVASAVLFLASDAASYTSGAILDVNGASYLRT